MKTTWFSLILVTLMTLFSAANVAAHCEVPAHKIQHIVSQYFMTQRIKLDAKNYSEKLAVLQKMLVYAMNCKQTPDLTHVATLRSLLKEFETLYFGHQ
jgi:nickel superoxide dismutase